MCIMINREWLNDIPLCFQEKYGLKIRKDKDRPTIYSKTRQQARSFAQATVNELKRRVRPAQRGESLPNF